MSAYPSLQALNDAIDAYMRTKAAIDAGATKNDPTEMNTLLKDIAETFFPKVLDSVPSELVFDRDSVLSEGNRKVQTGAEVFTLAASNNVPGRVVQFYLQGDGANTVTFSSDFFVIGDLVNGGMLTVNVTYLITVLFTGGKGIVNVQETPLTPLDNTKPSLSSAVTISATEILLTFSEDLDVNNAPDPSAFSLSEDLNPLAVSAVELNYTGDATLVKLTVAEVSQGTALLLDYTKPGANPLKDLADNEVDSFVDEAVTNTVAEYEFVLASQLQNMISEGSGDFSSSVGSGRLVGSKKLTVANGGGLIQFEFESQALNSTAVIGLDNLNEFADINQTKHAIYTNSSGVMYYKLNNGAVVNTGISPSSGHILRLEWDGANLAARYSTDGVNFTTLATVAESTAELFVIASTITANRRINNFQIDNGVAI